METQAPYGATPPGPRNLSAPVAQLLRELGFTVWEQPAPTRSMALVTGWWTAPSGAQFVFQYAHDHPPDQPWWGGCSLAVRPAPATRLLDCFTTTQVRRLREVRLLLLGNERFAQARAPLKRPDSSTPLPSPPCPSMPTK